jgi:hypothetical protein
VGVASSAAPILCLGHVGFEETRFFTAVQNDRLAVIITTGNHVIKQERAIREIAPTVPVLHLCSSPTHILKLWINVNTHIVGVASSVAPIFI